MQRLVKVKYLLLFVCFNSIFSCKLFPQKELKQVAEAQINWEQLQRDSLFKLIQVTKNDTLRADLYFQYFELTGSDEWIKYSPLIIKTMDSVLSLKKLTALQRNARLNRKANALRYCYYFYRDDSANSKKGVDYIQQAINIYKETGNDVEIAQCYVNLSEDYFKQGKLLNQLQTLQEGLKYESERKFNRGISRFYVQLQLFYANIGDTVQSLSYVEKALALEKIIADPTREARGYYLAGLTYSRMMKHQKAVDYLLKSVESYKKENMQQKDRMGQTYMLLGDEYLEIKEYDKALSIYEEIISKSSEKNDIRLMFLGTLAKGRAKSLKGENQEAINIHNNMLNIAKEKGAGDELMEIIYKELSVDYYNSRDYTNAQKNIKLAIEYSNDNAVAIKYNLEELAYKIDSAANFYEGAYKHYYYMHILKDKINKEEVAKSAAKERFLTELNNVKSNQEKENAIAKEEKKKQRVILFFVIGVLCLLAVLASIIFRSLRQSKKANKIISEQKNETEAQKHLVEEKQKEIIESITYAKRLQEAILPPQEFIDVHIPNNFILYKPKDLVAGDFYWAEKVNDLFFIAAADSTGHGVPGAMVSVVCSNALNRTVKEFKLTETGKILDKTRELVLETFEKSTSDVKDGMDISLLCIDSKNKNIFWSGANNPLWYIQDNELKEIKADKQPIGKTEYPKPFTTHQIEYKENTTFYLFTDGFADQFGGPNGKKFKYKQFSDLLFKNKDLLQSEQSMIIDKAFTEWKGNLEQVDDVCVIGIKT